MKKYKCKVCGAIFEVQDGEVAVCPKCKVTGDKLEEIASTNKYAGTQTEKNLEAAFAGESMARNKYTYFASKAKKEGFEQISAIFQKTADNEKEHAKGKIVPGYCADFVVLGHDPFRTAPAKIKDIPILQTWLEGERVW